MIVNSRSVAELKVDPSSLLLLLETSCFPALHEVFNAYVPLRRPQGAWSGFACGLCHAPVFSLTEDILPLTSLKIRQCDDLFRLFFAKTDTIGWT